MRLDSLDENKAKIRCKIKPFQNQNCMRIDFTIYHSQIPIDEEEKNALFTVKGLWECIQEIKQD